MVLLASSSVTSIHPYILILVLTSLVFVYFLSCHLLPIHLMLSLYKCFIFDSHFYKGLLFTRKVFLGIFMLKIGRIIRDYVGRSFDVRSKSV